MPDCANIPQIMTDEEIGRAIRRIVCCMKRNNIDAAHRVIDDMQRQCHERGAIATMTEEEKLDLPLSQTKLPQMIVDTLERELDLIWVRDLAMTTRKCLLSVKSIGESRLADIKQVMDELGVECPYLQEGM